MPPDCGIIGRTSGIRGDDAVDYWLALRYFFLKRLRWYRNEALICLLLVVLFAQELKVGKICGVAENMIDLSAGRAAFSAAPTIPLDDSPPNPLGKPAVAV